VETTTNPDPARHVVHPRIVASGAGAMVYDAALSEPPAWDWFDREWWRGRGALRDAGGGRGGVAFLDTPVGAGVLRHFRRGGLVAPLLGDRYLWSGSARSRGFAEFALLARLSQLGLPVPAPIAARYVRHGLYYSADLITRAIDGTRTLAELSAAGNLDAALAGNVGELVARFHVAGVDHADLNAHNILVAREGLWLIDFDRGEIRASGTAWKLANLARLKRSLLKVGACNGNETVLDRGVWRSLMRGYERVVGSV
jgi:3-deoxy-D-manno-octulosonic acid kinase